MKNTIEERIEEIALLSFSKQGYHETRTSEIAKHARVSETSIFRLFNTKKDLYLHILSKYSKTAKLNQNSIYSNLTFEILPEDLKTIAMHFMRFYFDNIHLTRIYLSNAIQIHDILGYEFLIYPELKDFLQKYLDEMETRGRLLIGSSHTFTDLFLSSIAQDIVSLTTFEKLEVLEKDTEEHLKNLWEHKVTTLLELFDFPFCKDDPRHEGE